MKKRNLAVRERALTEAARAMVAKSGKIGIRFQPDDIERIYSAADRYKRPIAELLREWVRQRLDEEEGKVKVPPVAELAARLDRLEKTVRRLKTG